MGRGRPIDRLAARRWRRPGWRVWIALLCSLGAGGCSLILDFSEGRDAGSQNPRCTALEPNDSAAAAAPIDAGTFELSLCGDDVDFFRVTLGAGEDLILSTSSDADIDLSLSLLQGGAVIDTSNGAGAAETIERSEAMGNRLDPGDYDVEVEGPEGDYDLAVEIIAAPQDAGVDGS